MSLKTDSTTAQQTAQLEGDDVHARLLDLVNDCTDDAQQRCRKVFVSFSCGQAQFVVN